MRGSRQIGHTEPRRLADESLPPVPHTERLIKSAVVEPHGQEATKPIDDGIAIRHQTARDVLCRGLGIIGDGQFIGEAIRLRRRLHQGVGVMPRHRQRASRPVVLKGPGDHPLAAGHQSRGDGIALEGGQFAPVKTRAHRGIPLDAAAIGQWQALRHESLSAGSGAAPASNSSAGS